MSANWQAATVTDSLIATDLDFSFDVLLDHPAQVALDLEVGIDESADFRDFIISERPNTCVGVDTRLCADDLSPVQSDAIYVRERNFETLVPRYVYS